MIKKIPVTLILLLFCQLFIFSQEKDEPDKVKEVILAFQEDFNQGEFLKANSYTTEDWVHINPLGGISRGRDDLIRSIWPG